MAVNAPPPAHSLLTLQEVSMALRVSEKTVRRLIGRRELRAFRVGGQLRVQRDSVIDLLRRGEI
jgi:excisionase family DNA binding protein